MRRLCSLFLLALLLVCGGCTLTLHSLFTAKDLVFDDNLVGKWTAQDATWDIKPFDKKTGRYMLTTTMKNQPPAQFYAYLGEVKGVRFLELLPKRPDAIHPKTFYGGHFVTLRSFWKVSLGDSALTLTPLSSRWLESMIKQNKLTIKYEKPEDGVLFLTASTQELQDLVTTYADDPGAFPTTGDEKGLAFVRATEEATK
jgi:hypothetical protein